MLNFEALLEKEEYSFLKENRFLGENIGLLAYGGSIAYGTNTPESDIDIRGMAVNNTKQLFNLENDFEQVVDIDTDTTIYSLNKMVKLLLSCNPNTIEILGCKPEHYLYINKYGEKLLQHKKDFLSIKAIDSFGGYASQQYNRLEHGLLGNGDNDDKKLLMLKHSIERDIEAFNAKHSDLHMNLELQRVSTEEFNAIYNNRTVSDDVSNEHLLVNGSFVNVPVTDFKTIISEIHKIQSEYGNINKRNTKKTDKKLAKHMMHLIRLYLMGTDLNSKGEIQTYREAEHDLLMDIRNGKYMTGDGMRVRPEFYELLEDIQNKYQYSLKNTVLPERANYEALSEMMLGIYKERLDA